MSLRDHNAACLEHWLDHDYPDRIAGRMPPETMIFSRQLTASVPLKKGAYDRVDDYYRFKAGTDEEGNPLNPKELDWLRRRYETDLVLLDLTDPYLRDLAKTAPKEDRARYYLMHSAFRTICLSENTAGGMVELERWEAHDKKVGRHKRPDEKTPAMFARMALEQILDELDRRGFRLEVEEDPRQAGEDNYKKAWVPRHADQYERYLRIAEERRELTSSGMGSVAATNKVAKNNGVSISTVKRACSWARKNRGDPR